MNKFFLPLLSFLILLIPLEATAQSICLVEEDKKVIGISNENVFQVKGDCTATEVETEYKELPTILFKDGDISNTRVRISTIEEAIEILKKTKRKLEKTEDLMKLIDFLPTAMPLKISIIEFTLATPSAQLEFDFSKIFIQDTKHIAIVLINSENILMDQTKNHKVIAIPNI